MKDALGKLALSTIIILALVAASGCGVGSGKTSEPSKPSEQASSAGQPDPATVQRRQLLETVGVLTAANCYQTYLNIGLIADGKAKGTYTYQDASNVLDSVRVLLNSVDRNL